MECQQRCQASGQAQDSLTSSSSAAAPTHRTAAQASGAVSDAQCREGWRVKTDRLPIVLAITGPQVRLRPCGCSVLTTNRVPVADRLSHGWQLLRGVRDRLPEKLHARRWGLDHASLTGAAGEAGLGSSRGGMVICPCSMEP
jgi:hypothetical protein